MTSLDVWRWKSSFSRSRRALLEREDGLELVEPRLGGADLVLERADLLRDGRDLRAEHALALARPIDLGLELVDPGVDDLLALLDVLAGRRPPRPREERTPWRGQ